jgi:putative acyl-CoA dehydrogenase
VQWSTHDISNQVPPLQDYNLFDSDPQLQAAVERNGAHWHTSALRQQGGMLGEAGTLELAELANRHSPELHTHDACGRRIDSIEFHPSWHALMGITRSHGLVSLPFSQPRAGVWSAYAASQYLHNQVEAGTYCPISMTFASIPVLRREPALFSQIGAALLSHIYDARDLPVGQKNSMLVGMGMTEKQGGSDVRNNTTHALALRTEGRGAEYLLIGHKWFFSAPMCDAHLVLARAEDGLSCFYVPRRLPDGSKNKVEIQRLKDKLGNRSNASSEVEFKEAWGVMVGEPGRGIPTILEMATYTRLHNVISSAALMRQACAQSLHYTRHRQAFGRCLAEQPLMMSVLADMLLESEAAMLLALHLAQAFERTLEPSPDPVSQAWQRIVTPAAKFWICKRAVELTGEAMEVFGGNGYVETGPMARLFREAPVNSIWEGSGNVMCLDVLRAITRDADAARRLLADLEAQAGDDRLLGAQLHALRAMLAQAPDTMESNARRIVQKLVLIVQGCLMRLQAPASIADAFLASRFDSDSGRVYGSLPPSIDRAAILARAWQG